MSHALRIEDITAIEPDPHLAFAHLVNGLVPDALVAMKIKAAAALYAGKCTARALSELGTQVPRFAERDNPLAPVPRAVVAPASATTEFKPMTPDSHDDHSESTCHNDDASASAAQPANPPAAASSTTSPTTALDAAQPAKPSPQHNGSADPAAANVVSAGTSADASSEMSATSKQPAANAQAAHGAAATAGGHSPKPTRRRLGTR